MKANGIRGALALALTATLAAAAAWPAAATAQKLDANGIGRTEAVRHDFDGKREAIQVKVRTRRFRSIRIRAWRSPTSWKARWNMS
jgi:hypothetical protein